MTEDSAIFKFNNLTDFEKLLFEQGHVKELKKEISTLSLEIGFLKSEKDELKHRIKQENPTADKLAKYKVHIKRQREKTRYWQKRYFDSIRDLVVLKNSK